MKTIHTTTQPTHFPRFRTEEWLQIAIDELGKRKMTPDERFAYERTLAINAEAIRVVNAQVQAAKQEVQAGAIRKMLQGGKLSVTEIADYAGVPLEVVERVQRDGRSVN